MIGDILEIPNDDEVNYRWQEHLDLFQKISTVKSYKKNLRIGDRRSDTLSMKYIWCELHETI